MTAVRSRRQTRGVSLIEAVVALAIVGIGMVGLVGIQASLRMNSDMAKQRSEAVRLAQDAIERWRGFETVDEYLADIDTDNDEEFEASAVPVGSAIYKTRRTVTPAPVPLRGKALKVDVEWRDRNDDLQKVQLSTMIAGVAPELAGTLALPPGGIPARNPRGRSFVIPATALDLKDGTSALRLPGDGGVAWRFDNLTGVIRLCTTTAATTPDITAGSLTCADGRLLMLSGFLRYATAAVDQPTAGHAADPPGIYEALSIVVHRTEPTPATTVSCHQELDDDAVSYYCAVPLVPDTLGWSGSLVFGAPLSVAATADSKSANERRICKYLQNVNLVDIRTGLANQNYLVIKAGDGTGDPVLDATATSFTCPDGTAPHQPI